MTILHIATFLLISWSSFAGATPNGRSTTTVPHGDSRNHLFVELSLCQGANSSVEVGNELELYRCVKNIKAGERKHVLVTGGAGFVGSHLVDSLMLDGHQVSVLDNFYTGRIKNVHHWLNHKSFKLIEIDVVDFNATLLDTTVDEIYHLASPASPIHYMADPVKTIKTISLGSMKMLQLANDLNITILIASTSEIYGDPLVHPQSETYWGNANPIGPRSCYDESKRLSESLAIAYRDQYNVSIRIARIFNTYGPRMHPNDGRVVSNFVSQAISNKPITVYGNGSQTRSFQYVSDLVSGLKKLMSSNVTSPMNLGNPEEMTINSLAAQVKQTLPNSKSPVRFYDLPVDDPMMRRPDIRKAVRLLGWNPVIPLKIGLEKTISYFIRELA